MGNLFYTGKGDRGQSDLGGKKIDKTSPEIEAVGAIDELNSLIGVLKTHSFLQEYVPILHEVQETLFIVQAHIGSYMMGNEAPEFSRQTIEQLEQTINSYEQQVQPERGFVIPGETAGAAWLDYARTVARRAEVKLLLLQKAANERNDSLEPTLFSYMNRLSSLLYAMARFAAKSEHKREAHPHY